MSECLACNYSDAPYACLVPEGSEEGKGSLQVELLIVVNFHMGHLQEQQVFLTAGLSLQSHDADFL